jgi:elongation factor G
MSELTMSYRETIQARAEARGKCIRETGERKMYGDVAVAVEPLPRGGGCEFVSIIEPGRIPARFIPDVMQGVYETIEAGVAAGFPIVDLRVTLTDGSFHDLYSTAQAFRVAGSIAVHDAVMAAQPLILMPIVRFEAVVPRPERAALQAAMRRMGGIVLKSESAEPNAWRMQGTVPLPALIQARAPEDGPAAGADPAAVEFDWSRGFRVQFSHFERTTAEAQRLLVERAHRELAEEAAG